MAETLSKSLDLTNFATAGTLRIPPILRSETKPSTIHIITAQSVEVD